MLEKIVVGWQEIEDVFLANTSLNKPFILLGRHGICKTTVARELSKIYGEDGFRFYDATKDDLVSIAGIPIPEKLAAGKLEFSKHNRSIWDAKVIVVDELTRANKENQNLWLEILEEKTCFGKSLQYEMFIATMNPDSYASTFKLDEALLDRFYAVIPVPELQKGTTSSVYKELINLNLNKRNNNFSFDMKEKVEEIRKRYENLKNNKSIIEGVVDYVSNFFEVLLSQTEIYVSPRKIVQLTEEILAIASTGKNIEESTETAIVYTLSIPLKIELEILMQIHTNLKPLLNKYNLSETDKIRLEISKLTDKGKVLLFLEENLERVEENLPYDEFEKLIAEIDVKGKELLVFQKILQKVKGHDEQKRRINGKVALEICEKVGNIIEKISSAEVLSDEDIKMRKKVLVFSDMIRKMPLSQEVMNFLFSEDSSDREKIIQFIKEVTNENKSEID